MITKYLFIFLAVMSLNQDVRPPLAAGRPKCNSILHLFGEWLFEAAFIGTDGWSQNLPREYRKINFSYLEII